MYRLYGLAIALLAVSAHPALAGSAGAQAVPAPIAGIGLPALAVVGGAYWLGRKFFGRKK